MNDLRRYETQAAEPAGLDRRGFVKTITMAAVLRTVHSFDPCLACAVHALDTEGRELARVKVL
jgi:Ni,Fe-hydrogenase I large subunit